MIFICSHNYKHMACINSNVRAYDKGSWEGSLHHSKQHSKQAFNFQQVLDKIVIYF